MYEAHFGLSGRPFAETVAPSSAIALPSRDVIMRRIRYGLEHGRGPALIFGPPGAGKTLLARVLAREIGGLSAHLTFPALSAAELLTLVADEFGVDGSGRNGVAGTLRALHHWLSARASSGEQPLLIVDECHLIDDPAVFETLRLLLNFATNGPPDLALLLVGGPEVVLRLPPAFIDRLTARCVLGPLAEAEAGSYLNGRLASAGASRPFFSPPAVSVLHRVADGLPRRLNRLADLAMLVAYAEGLPQPDERCVSIAAREFEADDLAA